MQGFKWLSVGLVAVALTGCASYQNWQAPVSKLSNLHSGKYIVNRGDTLRSVAYGLDVTPSQLAQWNHLQPPYQLYIGQTLYLSQQPDQETEKVEPVVMEPGPVIVTPPPKMSEPKIIESKPAVSSEPKPVVQKPVVSNAKPKLVAVKKASVSKTKPAAVEKPKVVAKHTTKPSEKPNSVAPVVSREGWIWPVQGQVTQSVGGVDIAAKAGTPVLAAKGGTVIYTGPDVSGQGQMVIVSHGDGLLSAYGNLQSVSIKEHEPVSRATQIGRVGALKGVGELHFEIRQNGQVKNPRLYLS